MVRKLLALALVGAVFSWQSPAVANDTPSGDAAKEEYVCPPCGAGCDDEVHPEPGQCAQCGMTLIVKTAVMQVAILVFPGVELLDFAGPGEVFSAATYHGGNYNVSIVAATSDPIESQGILSVNPEVSIANCPAPDVLVIPGGNIGNVLNSEKLMDWIRDVSKDAKVVLSVCNGAFALADLGFLDGLEATTHHSSIRGLRDVAPDTKVLTNRRFVDNGKFVTAAGVSAGIDASLHVVSRLNSLQVAREVARYMEYDWKPSSSD